MTEWQPIATAPKDGTRLLVSDRDMCWISRWDAPDGDDDTDVIPDWVIDHDIVEDIGHVPTHWMPLPDPPALRLVGCDCGQDGHPDIERHAHDCNAVVRLSSRPVDAHHQPIVPPPGR